jgi:hypothetical protein
MAGTQRNERWSRTQRAAALAVILCAWVACGTLATWDPQDWDPARGPVVPHDTFPADCSLCHLGPGWHTIRADFEFDHGKETGHELEGAHRGAQCLRCHNDRGPVEVFAARGCAGCHVDPHRGKLGASCDSCHDQRTWLAREAIAQHGRTRFPLVGAHATVACFACHPGAQVGNFEGLDTACETCHAQDLARARVPDHVQQGWTSDCQRCHVAISWVPSRFDHPAAFPLAGGHAGVACASCHGGSGTFTGLSNDCASCHLADYQSTREPDHAQAGFSTDCRMCHDITRWQGARFAHSAGFPLTGGHGGRACADCHTAARGYVNVPTDCVACHLQAYQGTRNPNHATAGFPTDCRRCHDTTRWTGARFEHRFPISSGAHSGFACADCHTAAAPAPAFSCIDCHAHSRSEMDDEHRGVAGYSYSSPACYSCHPTGRER